MFSTPSSPAIAGLQAMGVAALLLALGYLVADLVTSRLKLGRTTRLGLAFPGLTLYALVLMLSHIATGGRILSNPGLTRAITAIAAVGLSVAAFLRRRGRTYEASPPEVVWPAWLLVAMGVVIFCAPVGRMIPLDHVWDTNLHTGWASQLMAGEPVPSATVTGDVPNYYPWLFHALLASIAHLTPGGRAFHALGPLQFLQVAGAILAFFALGRALSGRCITGAAASLFGALSGGFGYILLRKPDVILDPRANDGAAAVKYWGDLIATRPYNVGFQNLTPPFPRDVAYVLVVVALLFLVIGIKERSAGSLVAGGVTIGMVGLTGGETFIVSFLAVVLLALTATEVGRARLGALVLIPALATYALWAGPMVINYFRLGGFFGTAARPVVLTPLAVLGSWGLVTPFALYGLVRRLPRWRTDPGTKVVLAALMAAVLSLIASAALPLYLGRGFSTLGRDHRYWPLVFLALAPLAALGSTELLGALVRVSRRLGIALAALTVLLAIPSPLLASIALPAERGSPEVLAESLEGDPDTVLNLIAPRPGMRCVIAAPVDFSQRVFSYTGYRMVLFRWGPGDVGRNAAHIRWAGIYRRIPGGLDRLQANRVLTGAPSSKRRWNEVADAYGVDVVVAPAGRASAPVFRGLRQKLSSSVSGQRFVVVWRRACV
ncbi:MAG: hypothetical protein M3346_04980 [Actinomycetota bacterium]|nr:hypothetical protein [Actinomycetota bacterium]